MCFRAASSGIANCDSYLLCLPPLAIVASPYIWDREMGSTVPNPGEAKR